MLYYKAEQSRSDIRHLFSDCKQLRRSVVIEIEESGYVDVCRHCVKNKIECGLQNTQPLFVIPNNTYVRAWRVGRVV